MTNVCANGPTSWSPDDPLRALFSLARYKYVARRLKDCRNVLEIGAGDARNAHVVAWAISPGQLTVTDRNPGFHHPAQLLGHREPWRFDAEVLDVLTDAISIGSYDGIYALDVLEHIPASQERAALANICNGLTQRGTVIIGMPSLESQVYASSASKVEHVNCKSQADLHALLKEFFHHVFDDGMNDEVVHTGFEPMCHYLLALCCGKRT